MIKIELEKHIESEIRKLHLKYFNEKALPKLRKFINNKKGTEPEIEEERRFLRFLLKIRNQLLLGSPYQLEKIMVHIHKNYSYELREKIKQNKTKKRKASILNSELRAVFNYDSFCKSDDIGKWCAYQLLQLMNIQVCPYCNRQYISTIYTEQQKTRAQLDHFFDKATYPYLSISLYNLIPCCATCNSSLKGTSKFYVSKNIHPYVAGFGESYKFTINLPDKIESLITNQGEIEISFKRNTEDLVFIEKAKRNVKSFLLDKLYNVHTHIVKETIQKHIIYPEDYIESLLASYPSIFTNKEDVMRMIYSSEVNERKFNQRPFSKLITDISKELQLKGRI
ncbi:hypothetical protein AB1I80_24405 [Bacillus paranthracis]|uniref:hypothetical protein n=1 Tax=Bacillus paranthracis TaxID=2026186 RepID=UPI003556FA57